MKERTYIAIDLKSFYASKRVEAHSKSSNLQSDSPRVPPFEQNKSYHDF